MSENLSIAITWFGMLLPIPMIIATWFALLTKPPQRMAWRIRVGTVVVTISYALIVLELMVPTILGHHYSDGRAATILANIGIAAAILVIGVVSKSTAGFVLGLSGSLVGLVWLYMGIIGTAA